MDRKSFIKGSVLTTSSILLAGANGVYVFGKNKQNIRDFEKLFYDELRNHQ